VRRNDPIACSVDVDASPVAVVLSSWRALGPSVNLSLSSSAPLTTHTPPHPLILHHKNGTLHQHDITQITTPFISLHIRILCTLSPWFVAQWRRHFQDHTKAITLASPKICRLHGISQLLVAAINATLVLETLDCTAVLLQRRLKWRLGLWCDPCQMPARTGIPIQKG
jgi:hypothetical protein